MISRKQLKQELDYYKRLYICSEEQSEMWFERYCNAVFENGKLIKENKQLKKQIAKLSKKV